MNYCELILRLILDIFNYRAFNEYPEVLIQKLYDSAVCFLSFLLLIESFQKPGTFFFKFDVQIIFAMTFLIFIKLCYLCL